MGLSLTSKRLLAAREPALTVTSARLEEGHFDASSDLLYDGLLPRLDLMIVAALEKLEPLVELRDLAIVLDVKEDALRQRSHRGKLIAVKRGKKLYSHPRLYLGRPQPRGASSPSTA